MTDCTITTPLYHQKSVTPSNTSEPPIFKGTSTHDSIPPNVGMLDKEPKALDNGAKNSSWAWDHFIQLSSDTKKPKSKCRHCGKVYACGKKKIGTSNMLAHLNYRSSQFVFKRDSKQKQLFMQPKTEHDEGKLIATSYNEEKCREALARFVLLDEAPFKTVEGKRFKYMLGVFEPRFHVPCRTTIACDVLQLYIDEKKKLKDFIVRNQQRVCLTTDTWTSIQNINYMCLTAHFVDRNWKLQKKILSFCPISNHKGNTIGKILETCLKSWAI
ncbi:hypothetical protein Ddye_021094 [Dipteronia dyeriana]|uniref:BED-type domain-containing protein n=1 Tax=Dipteronia dyeriana TaxID=168575 RepID=A0AAD9WW04_9ROSI|nr:hypothetical protein Ddye_021094 [Dipteronia dyeriana]